MDHSLKAYGKKTWLIPDTFLNSVSGKDEQPSHEAICVINTSGCDAHIKMTAIVRAKRSSARILRGMSVYANKSYPHG